MAQILNAGRLRRELQQVRESTEFFVEIGGVLRQILTHRVEVVPHNASHGQRRMVFSLGDDSRPQAVPAQEPIPVVVAEEPAEDPAPKAPKKAK